MTEGIVLQFSMSKATTSAFITVVKMVSVRFSDWNSTRLGSSSRIWDTTLSNERLNMKYAKPQITRHRTQQPIQKKSGRYLRTLFLTLIDSFDTKQIRPSSSIPKPLLSFFLRRLDSPLKENNDSSRWWYAFWHQQVSMAISSNINRCRWWYHLTSTGVDGDIF